MNERTRVAAEAGARRVPVSVLTGFFGSGKTTLLARALAAPGRGNVAVVNNDFGDSSFIHALEAPAAGRIADVTAGCVCCTRAAGLAAALLEALDALPPPAHIVVETSGIADPAPVLRILLGDAAVAPRLRLAAVVTVFDAVHGFAQLERYPEARRQAALADRIVLTKLDLAGEAEVDTLTQALRRLAPDTDIIAATGSGLDIDALFAPAPERRVASGPAATTHSAGLTAHEFAVETTVSRDALALFMDLMAAYRGGSALRVKGILDVDGRPTELQGVMQAFHPPLPLPTWPGGERRPRLVIICDGLTRADLAPAIAALDFGRLQKGRMPTPETYARFRAIADRLRQPATPA